MKPSDWAFWARLNALVSSPPKDESPLNEKLEWLFDYADLYTDYPDFCSGEVAVALVQAFVRALILDRKGATSDVDTDN